MEIQIGYLTMQGCKANESYFLKVISYDSSSSALFTLNLNTQAFCDHPTNALPPHSLPITLPFIFFSVAFLCSYHYEWFSHVCVFFHHFPPLVTKSPENNNISCSPLFLNQVTTAVYLQPLLHYWKILKEHILADCLLCKVGDKPR